MARVVTVAQADVIVKWFDNQKGFGFFIDENNLFVNAEGVEQKAEIFVHRSKLGSFHPWELQEGAPAVISYATGSNSKLQVTEIHSICLIHVKQQGDTFSLPEPKAEIPVEAAPAPVEEVVLKMGGHYRGLVGKVMPGFGFLKVDGMGKFLFFHNTALPDSSVKPKIGQVYDFTLGSNDKGPAAEKMVLVEPEAPPSAETTLVVEASPAVNEVVVPVEAQSTKKLTRSRRKVNGGKPSYDDAIPPVALVAPQDGVTLDSLAGLACLLPEAQLQPAG